MINELHLTDCIEGMDRLIDDGITVDCIVTSPPYNLGGDFHTMVGGRRVSYGDYKSPYKDKVKESDYQDWQVEFLNKCYEVLSDDGVMFYNHKNRLVKGSVISPFEWIGRSKFNISQVVVMNLKSTANVDKRRFFPVHELIFVLTKSPSTKLNNSECLTDVWELRKVPRRVSGHPATFHEELPRRCIESCTSQGDLVLDPFVGSGTVACVSKSLGRNFIGMEISQEYLDIAHKRLSEVTDTKEGE